MIFHVVLDYSMTCINWKKGWPLSVVMAVQPAVRQCEMGQAVLKRLREDSLARPKCIYFGLLFDKEGKDAEQLMQEKVYSSWDQDPQGPPRTRQRDPVPDPNLQVLGWQDGHPFFPESLLQKFASGTASHKQVLKMKDALQAKFPSIAQPAPSGRSTIVAPRASGRPDYTIEGGKSPLDPTRCIDLATVAAANFTEPRRPLFDVMQLTILFGGFPDFRGETWYLIL